MKHVYSGNDHTIVLEWNSEFRWKRTWYIPICIDYWKFKLRNYRLYDII